MIFNYEIHSNTLWQWFNQKYFILFANNFYKWDKAIEMSKAILYLSSLNIRDSQIFIINNNTILFNDDFSSSYSFPSSSYSFPSSSYSFVIYKERILYFSIYFNNSWELIIVSIDIYSYFRWLVFSFIIDSFRNMSYSDFHSVK